MKIIIAVDPEIPVPPKLYGGIERIVEMLIVRYAEKGHEVTLFSHPESSVECERIAWKGLTSASLVDTLRNARQLAEYVGKLPSGDVVVHSFARLVYLLPLFRKRVPLIQSYQRAITARSVEWGEILAGRNLRFTACSQSCALSSGNRVPMVVIHNGVPIDRYPFTETVADQAPLVFLGRLERIKGPHTAVEIARRSGRRLIIAGNESPDPGERAFVEKEVLAYCDGKNISYVGPVNDAQKATLLNGAAALVFPIEWEEPFGIVMAEALACGAPVLATPRGSVPEVVQNGVNGFIGSNVEELVAAIARLPELSRAKCRKTAEQRFSDRVIAEQYLDLYAEALRSLS